MKCKCGKHELKEVSYGTVCAGCLGYPDRCLCKPEDLRRVLWMLGVIDKIEQAGEPAKKEE